MCSILAPRFWFEILHNIHATLSDRESQHSSQNATYLFHCLLKQTIRGLD